MTECTHGEVRLEGGVNATHGRLELCREGIWTSVCAESLPIAVAQLICDKFGHRKQGLYLA